MNLLSVTPRGEWRFIDNHADCDHYDLYEHATKTRLRVALKLGALQGAWGVFIHHRHHNRAVSVRQFILHANRREIAKCVASVVALHDDKTYSAEAFAAYLTKMPALVPNQFPCTFYADDNLPQGHHLAVGFPGNETPQPVRTAVRHNLVSHIASASQSHRILPQPRATKKRIIEIADNDNDTAESAIEAECVICFERQPNTLVLPCGHCVTCVSCSERLRATNDAKICVKCRRPITRVLCDGKPDRVID